MLAPSAEAVTALWQRGREAWPAIAVPADAFAAHVARLLGEDVEPEVIARLCGDDLYLACGCARGDAAAIAAFAARLGPEVERAVARIDRRPAAIAELRQAVMVRLLVADGAGRRPRIDGYSGRGALAAWVRLAATRAALNARRDDGRLVPTEDADLHLAERAARDAVDPELGYLRERYQPAFAAAFAAALAALSREQRHLLRLHYLDGLTLDALAGLLGGSRAGLHRRLAAARDALFAHTCERLRAQLGVDTAELDSVIRLVRSDLELRLSHLLGSHGGG